MGIAILTTPIYGQFAVNWLILAMIHLHTKFEMPSLIHSTDMLMINQCWILSCRNNIVNFRKCVRMNQRKKI